MRPSGWRARTLFRPDRRQQQVPSRRDPERIALPIRRQPSLRVSQSRTRERRRASRVPPGHRRGIPRIKVCPCLVWQCLIPRHVGGSLACSKLVAQSPSRQAGQGLRARRLPDAVDLVLWQGERDVQRRHARHHMRQSLRYPLSNRPTLWSSVIAGHVATALIRTPPGPAPQWAVLRPRVPRLRIERGACRLAGRGVEPTAAAARLWVCTIHPSTCFSIGAGSPRRSRLSSEAGSPRSER